MQQAVTSLPIRTAVLLAAGRGQRLRPRTDRVPKCLVPVAGRTMLDRTVDALAAAGFERLVVATGYRAAQVETALGRTGGLEVALVHIADHARTNNVVSLEQALQHPWCTDSAEPGVLVMEADLVLDEEALSLLRLPDRVAVAPYDPGTMSGTVLALDAAARVQAVHVGGPPPGPPPADGWWKTVNATALSAASLVPVRHALSALIRADRTDVYYETAFAECVGEGTVSLGAVSFAHIPWFEIDTAADLARAERALGSGGPDRKGTPAIASAPLRPGGAPPRHA